MALGAGLGQFAQDFRQQQAQQERSLMLQMQLAEYQRALDKDKRESEASGLALNFGLPGAGGAPGGSSFGLPPSPSSFGGSPATAGGGGGMTLAEVKAAARRAGFDEDGANTMAAISVPESSLNPNAYNPNDPSGGSFGLTQINGVHPGAREALGNPDRAMELAFRVSKGGTNFSPWTAYRSGAYKPYLAEASRILPAGPSAAPASFDRGRAVMDPSMPNTAEGRAAAAPMSEASAGYAEAIGRGFRGTIQDFAGRGGGPQTAGPAVGQQMAQAQVQGAPVPPPSLRDIALLLRSKNPTTDSRVIWDAADRFHKREQENYKLNFERWKASTGFAGDAATRAETSRHHQVSEGFEGQKISLEEQGLKEKIAAGTATRADQLRNRELEERRIVETERANREKERGDAATRTEAGRHHQVTEGFEGQKIGLEEQGLKEKIAAGTATRADALRNRELEERRIAETERANRAREKGVAANTQARIGKETSKVDLATTELETLANEADQLSQMVEANPKLVGAKGIVGRAVGSVGEQLGILDEDPALAQFKSKVQLLQSRLAKPLLGARYFSKPSQDRLNQLLPGLQRLDNPTAVVQSLKNVSEVLKTNAAAMKAASGAVSEDISKLTDDEIKKQLGLE